MDTAGKNRYELLFMDDEASEQPFETVVTNKKQAKNLAVANGGNTGKPASSSSASNKVSSSSSSAGPSNKKQNQSEKENKPINKDDLNKKNNASNINNIEKVNRQGGQGAAASGGANNTNIRKRNNGEIRENGQSQRSVNFKQQNGEAREQRNQNNNNNRRNFKENGGNFAVNATTSPGSEQQSRQFRDRGDGRGPPPRNRNFEGGNRKREYDRQSGSDKTVDKRDGAGTHNWGSVKETIDDVNNKENDDVHEKSDDAVNGAADQTLTEQTQAEEETKELTLDEWKAQQQQRVKPTFNIRKAGEGEDTSQWKKMIVLNNNKKKENESEEELEFDPAMYPQRVGRQQRLLDIQFNFNDGRRGGFGNRGRGGRRPPGGVSEPHANYQNNNNAGNTNNNNANASSGLGAGANVGGGRGGRRYEGGRAGGKRIYNSDRQQNIAPKVNDERQFPTLG